METVKDSSIFEDINGDPFMIVSSKGQRWIIDLKRGKSIFWQAKSDIGTIESLSSLGYAYCKMFSEFGNKVSRTPEVKLLPPPSLEEIPLGYSPLNSFDKLLEEKLK